MPFRCINTSVRRDGGLGEPFWEGRRYPHCIIAKQKKGSRAHAVQMYNYPPPGVTVAWEGLFGKEGDILPVYC